MEGSRGFWVSTCCGENLGEVEQRIALHPRRVRVAGVRHRLSGEPLGVRVLALVGFHERRGLPPERLGHQVVLVGVVAGLRRQLVRLVVAVERAELASSQPGVRSERRIEAAPREAIAQRAQQLGRALVVPRELLDLGEPRICGVTELARVFRRLRGQGPRLVDPVAHREQERAAEVDVPARVERLAALQRLVDGTRAELEPERLHRVRAVRHAGERLVVARLLGRLHHLLVPAAVDAAREREPDLGETGMIESRLEQGDRRQCEPLFLVERALGSPVGHVRRECEGERRAGGVSPRLGPSRDLAEPARCGTDVRLAHRERGLEVEIRLLDELERTTEERAGGARVTAPARALTGGREACRCLLGNGRVGTAELGQVARRLLEMEAEDLLELDEVATVSLEPDGEALVQVGTDRLGQGVVGGVADQ